MSSTGGENGEKIQKSDAEWKKSLTAQQFQVLRLKGTEPARTGEYDRFYPSEGHFVCAGCLERMVAEDIKNENLARFGIRGGVRCPGGECAAPVYTDQALARHLPEACFAGYTKAKELLAEQRISVTSSSTGTVSQSVMLGVAY